MRRAQASVLLLGLSVPLLALALACLAVLGAHVQGIRAQRLAERAALRGALRAPGSTTATVELPVVRLRLPFVGIVAYTPRARATARHVRTDEGRPGAVLVG